MTPALRPTTLVCLALIAAGSTLASAPPLLPPESVALDSLAAFQAPAANWQVAGGVGADPRTQTTLVPMPGRDVLVNRPTETARGHLVTAWEHGDLDVELEFLLPVGANSGVYLMGRYEIQLFDSWGVREPQFSDAGGVYERWDPVRGSGREGFDGHPPRANAARAPGLWQKLRIEFRAPRFDANGTKIASARFARVELNGFVVHENVEVHGPTRAALFDDERAMGPLMIQGDHGPVAIRRLACKHYDDNGARVWLRALTYRVHAGEFARLGDYDAIAPTATGALEELSLAPIAPPGLFGAVVTGTVTVPRDGRYAFDVEAREPVRVMIGDREVVTPLHQGGHPGTIELTAGSHPLRLDYLHAFPRAVPTVTLHVEGPRLARHALGPTDGRRPPAPPRTLPVVVGERTLAQRGFVPFAPRKRLYALSIGTPAGVHFAYDTESAALLRVWRGAFLDTFEMWHERGHNQLAKPLGPALTLSGRPALALIETGGHDWADAPETLWTFEGYRLAADGTPTFAARLADLRISDRLAPTTDGRGLARTLRVTGQPPDWQAWVLLALADTITEQPDGRGYIVGDREHYIDLPPGGGVRPVVRRSNGRQHLAVQLPGGDQAIETTIDYTIVW